MTRRHKTLLAIDGVVNLILKILLLAFPLGMADLLGVPQTDVAFYSSILGAVILGFIVLASGPIDAGMLTSREQSKI